MQPADFHSALAADHAVSRVVRNFAKTSHGNTGNRHVEQSLLVHVEGFPGKPVEFELALHEHVGLSSARSHSLVACFKRPPDSMTAVAWQILMRVVHGKELIPGWARSYANAEIELAGDPTYHFFEGLFDVIDVGDDSGSPAQNAAGNFGSWHQPSTRWRGEGRRFVGCARLCQR